MQRTRVMALLMSASLLVAACSSGEQADEATETSGETGTESVERTTTTSPFSTTTTTTTVPPRYVPLLEEPPPFEEVTLTTEGRSGSLRQVLAGRTDRGAGRARLPHGLRCR